MNPFQLFYTYLMWQPQINALKFTFEQTHDMGYAIIFLAIVFNIPIFFLYFNSFLNMQKTKALGPKMRAIQTKFKEDPMEMRKQLIEFNKKHGINNSATFYMIVFQIVFLTGMYGIIQELGTKESNYLYNFLWKTDVFTFPSQIFGGPKVTDSVQPYLWITALTSLNAYLQGMVMFKWFPQIKVKPDPNQTEEQKDQAIAMERSQTFIGIYFTPILFLIINFNLPLGLGIYNLASTTITLLRLVFVSWYYRNHTNELIKQMDESDDAELDTYYEDKTENSTDVTPRTQELKKLTVNKKQVNKKKKK